MWCQKAFPCCNGDAPEGEDEGKDHGEKGDGDAVHFKQHEDSKVELTVAVAVAGQKEGPAAAKAQRHARCRWSAAR